MRKSKMRKMHDAKMTYMMKRRLAETMAAIGRSGSRSARINIVDVHEQKTDQLDCAL